jgi:hypothetical protein
MVLLTIVWKGCGVVFWQAATLPSQTIPLTGWLGLGSKVTGLETHDIPGLTSAMNIAINIATREQLP